MYVLVIYQQCIIARDGWSGKLLQNISKLDHIGWQGDEKYGDVKPFPILERFFFLFSFKLPRSTL